MRTLPLLGRKASLSMARLGTYIWPTTGKATQPSSSRVPGTNGKPRVFRLLLRRRHVALTAMTYFASCMGLTDLSFRTLALADLVVTYGLPCTLGKTSTGPWMTLRAAGLSNPTFSVLDTQTGKALPRVVRPKASCGRWIPAPLTIGYGGAISSPRRSTIPPSIQPPFFEMSCEQRAKRPLAGRNLLRRLAGFAGRGNRGAARSPSMGNPTHC